MRTVRRLLPTMRSPGAVANRGPHRQWRERGWRWCWEAMATLGVSLGMTRAERDPPKARPVAASETRGPVNRQAGQQAGRWSDETHAAAGVGGGGRNSNRGARSSPSAARNLISSRFVVSEVRKMATRRLVANCKRAGVGRNRDREAASSTCVVGGARGGSS